MILHLRFILLVSVILAFASSLQAQTIAVRSGEHPGFTRLVLPIGTDREWSLVQQASGDWQLDVTPAVEGFDTSDTFNLIQRTRLANLVAAQSLTLELTCNCSVTGFRHQSRFLVIDISDPDPNAPLPVPVANSPEGIARAAAADALPDLANLLRAPDGLPQVFPAEAAATSPATAEVTEDTAPNPRLEQAAQIMAEQLARAAASGLLDIAPNQAMTAADPTEGTGGATAETVDVTGEVEREPSEDGATGSGALPGDAPGGSLPVRAETAFDTALQRALPIGLPTALASCENTPFVVADWSEGGGLYQDLGALRRDLYDERDVLTTDGAIALAQHYLYYGFGAEALYWLAQLEHPPEEYLYVAALLDGADTAAFTPVETTENCTPGELVWRYMAGAIQAPLTTEDTAAIQRAFGELPPGLRDHMGPRLAIQLVEEGYAGTARNIRDILHRGGRIDSVELHMLDLEMGISLDAAPEEIRQNLAEALRDDGGDPVSVLTHALAFDRSIGTLPAPSRLVTADALMRENGGGPETDDLWRETLLGHAALGQIDEALRRLGDPTRSEAARAEALTELIAERVNVGDTAALVVLAYSYGPDWRPEGSAAGRIQVQAISLLRENGLFEAAQILRDVHQPLILPAPDEPAPPPENTALLAWQAQDWALLADTGSGAHADIAVRLERLTTQSPDSLTEGGPPDLNALNDAVQDSRSMRDVIADLLAQPIFP